MSTADTSKLVGTKAPIEKLTLSVDEFCQVMGISRNHGFSAVRNGEVPHLKIGKRILIPRIAVERMLTAAAAPVAGEPKTAA
jgi:excisionase family DNA binding protein